MFTGIIEEIGIIDNIRTGGDFAAVSVRGGAVIHGLKTGDSVAVNGVCLTVTALRGNIFDADIMHETLKRSNLVSRGSRVNLERALPADGRFGGHIVSGHIDGTGRISGIKKDGIAVRYTIDAPQQIMRYIVEKGSVAVDGVSLTVAESGRESFTVSVIPHTLSITALPDKKTGSAVNLENDIIGKYICKLLGTEAEKTGGSVTSEFLTRNGFSV